MPQIFMNDRELLPEFSVGPIQFSQADTFPVSEVTHNIKESHITFGMFCQMEAPSPWRGRSGVVLYLCRIPDGIEELHRVIDFFGLNAQKKLLCLPEGVQFANHVLTIAEVPDECEQECYTRSSRSLFHIYWGEDSVVLVRLFSQSGTMLDHPLISKVVQNLQFVFGKWETAEIPTRPRAIAENIEINDQSQADESLSLRVDLQDDQDDFITFLKRRVAEFDPASNFGPGEGKKVSAIYIGLYSPRFDSISLIFDTRKVPNNDGSSTCYFDKGNSLQRPKWGRLQDAFIDAFIKDKVLTATVVTTGGAHRSIWDFSMFHSAIWEMLESVMSGAKSSGLLKPLPMTRNCFVMIEDVEAGDYTEFELR